MLQVNILKQSEVINYFMLKTNSKSLDDLSKKVLNHFVDSISLSQSLFSLKIENHKIFKDIEIGFEFQEDVIILSNIDLIYETEYCKYSKKFIKRHSLIAELEINEYETLYIKSKFFLVKAFKLNHK